MDLSFINNLFNKIASNNQHAHNGLLQSVKVPLPLLPAGCFAAAGIYLLQGNLALPDFVSFRLTWTATSTAAFGAYRATLASSPPRAPPLRSARYSATGVPRNLP